MLSINLINRVTLTACRCATTSNSFNYNQIRNFRDIQKDLKTNIENLQLRKELMNQELQKNYEPIYRFPKMKGIAAIHHLKNYQAIVTAIGIPISFAVVPDFADTFAYMGVTLTVSFCLASYFLKDSIGAVYVNKKDRDQIRIAFINFFGKRKDSFFSIDEIEPLGSANIFTKVKFINSEHHDLKFLLKNSEILNSQEFSRIFEDE